MAYGQQLTKFEKAVLAALDSSNYYTYDEFFGASQYDSLNVKDQFLFAEAARRMNAFGVAEDAYKRTIHLDSLEKEEHFPQAMYWLGAMKKIQGDYAEALPYFNQYLDTAPPVDNNYVGLAKKDIIDCTWAVDRVQNIDSYYKIEHLDSTINSKYSDFAPLLIGDQLYYSSLKYEIKPSTTDPPRLFAKTFISDLKTMAQPVPNLNIDNTTVAHVALSNNGQRLYFTNCQYKGKTRQLSCQLYYKDKTADGDWGLTQKLPDHINLDGYTSTQPAIGYDATGAETLYFVSNRPGGKGGLDIWSSKVLVEDFGKAYNHTVNTEKNDITPFYHSPTQTLYYSTNGEIGLGGYDIYSFDDAKKERTHTGYPLNSSFNDLYFTLDPTGEKGHFSSNRQGCIRLNELEKGCDDIFSVQFAKIDLKVLALDDQDEQLLGTTVTLNEMVGADCTDTATMLFSKTKESSNEFEQTNLKRNAWYQVITTKDGYYPDTLCFPTAGITTNILKKVRLSPIIYKTDLLALTFDDKTKLPLTNCTVQLEDLITGELFVKENPFGNDFSFALSANRSYCLIATNNANLANKFVPDTLCFDTKGLIGDTVLTKNLYLTPIIDIPDLNDLLPLTLYFDNNRPRPGQTVSTTTSNYEDLFYPYYRKKNQFLTKETIGKKGIEKTNTQAAINSFFEEDLKYNYDNLGVFSEALTTYLRSGRSAVIAIQGYASTLGKSVDNDNLSSRRVSCLMNHFRTYNNDVFREYIQNGQLKLQEVFYGEKNSPKTDEVYSLKASRQRKVEIIEVSSGETLNE